MKYLDMIKKRGVLKEFKQKKISPELNGKIFDLLRDMPKLEGSDLDVEYFERGGEVYSNLLKFRDEYDTLVKAPQYLAIFSDDKNNYENAGYIGEWFILELANLDLGAKWVEIVDGLDEIKSTLETASRKKLVGLIAFGYSVNEYKLGKIIKNKYRNSIKKLTDMGYPETSDLRTDDQIPYQLNIREFTFDSKFGKKIRENDLETSGLKRVFQELHLAPSISRVQPWRLIIDEGKIVVAMVSYRKCVEITRIEAGIVKFYLEHALINNGIKTQWHEEVPEVEKYKLPENVFVAGYFKY